jgi:uncharacterized protein GlcG (DUF336 family)
MAMSVKFAVVAGLSALLAPAAANAQVVTHRDVGAHMAMTMMQAATAKCEANGHGLTVAVVDRAGQVRGLIVADSASPHHPELAQRKAYTALTSRRTSAEWAQRTEPGSRIAGQRAMARVVPLAGGVPVKLGDETIGGIGVSGSSTEPDEVCAKAGLAAVADQLR